MAWPTNRTGADFLEGDIDLKKAEETIGRPIFWQIPNDSKVVIGARNEGVPLVQHAPKSKVQQSIAGLGLALCNKTNGQAAPQPKKERRGFFSFK